MKNNVENSFETVNKLIKAKDAYYNGQPIMSDKDFDELEAQLKSIDPTNDYFNIVGAPVTSNKKRKHKIPMGSLNKIKLEDDGVNTLIKDYLSKGDMVCSYKMDGISFSVDYKDGVFQSATTRGDGEYGEIIEDATTMGNVRENLNYDKFTGTLRGELIIEWDDFNYINSQLPDDEKFSNPRNATAGIVRKENSPYKKYVKAYYFNMIEDRTYKTKKDIFVNLKLLVGEECVVKHIIFGNGWGWNYVSVPVEDYVSWMDKVRKDLPYMIDGLVFEYNDLDYYNSLGESGGCPKGAVALKLSAVAETTNMTDVVWQVGEISGILCPVATVTPVLVDGSIVSRASMHNYGIFEEWNLGVGDEVEIQKNNDIIPQLKSVVKHVGEKFKAPTHCPLCETELVIETINTTQLKCPNLNCICRSLGNIKKLIDKLRLNQKGLGDAFSRAYVAKYDNVWSLFTLSEDDIKQISPRYKDKSAKNIYEAIQSSKECKLEDFFGALNIEGCDSRTFKRIIDHFGCTSIENVICVIHSPCIYDVGGLGRITIQKLVDGITIKSETIHHLTKHIKIISDMCVINSGFGSFLFTGKFSVNRKELEQMVVVKGGTIASSVNKNLDYLVQSDPTSTSSKSKRAVELGVKIIGEDEFMEMVKRESNDV